MRAGLFPAEGGVKNAFFLRRVCVGFLLIHRGDPAGNPSRGVNGGIFAPVYSQAILVGEY
ncbi:MAG TPA: hypothetical protein DDX86_03285 [Akkermansia sp.]|nr:hypothetical protein [Akkermansia sp.]